MHMDKVATNDPFNVARKVIDQLFTNTFFSVKRVWLCCHSAEYG